MSAEVAREDENSNEVEGVEGSGEQDLSWFFVVEEVGRRRRSTDVSWLGDGFPLGEKVETHLDQVSFF